MVSSYRLRVCDQAKDSLAIHALVSELAIYEEEPDSVKLTAQDLARDGFAVNPPLFHAVLAEHCARMEWNVLTWNTPSIEFYKSIGAHPMNDWSLMRMTEDAIGKFASADS